MGCRWACAQAHLPHSVLSLSRPDNTREYSFCIYERTCKSLRARRGRGRAALRCSALLQLRPPAGSRLASKLGCQQSTSKLVNLQVHLGSKPTCSPQVLLGKQHLQHKHCLKRTCSCILVQVRCQYHTSESVFRVGHTWLVPASTGVRWSPLSLHAHPVYLC